MTPQTPQGAALSDADIRDLVKECGLDWHRGFVPLFDGDPTNRYAVLVRAAIDADRRLTAEQGGAEPPKPFCHVVNMLEGLPENPSYIMLFDGQRFGNGFTHTALYTGEQLVAALTTQPQAEPATDWFAPDDMKIVRQALVTFSKNYDHDQAARNRAYAMFQVLRATAPTEPT